MSKYSLLIPFDLDKNFLKDEIKWLKKKTGYKVVALVEKLSENPIQEMYIRRKTI